MIKVASLEGSSEWREFIKDGKLHVNHWKVRNDRPNRRNRITLSLHAVRRIMQASVAANSEER